MLLLLLACTDGPALNAGKPEMVVTPARADFGEVVLGNQSALGMRVRNDGYGDLQFESVALGDGTSLDFAVVAFPEALGHDEEGVLELRYTPDVEGQDFGTVVLTSNDIAAPVLTVELEGMGVLPRIDVDPEVLYFGTVPPGESVTLSTRVTAAGSGDLRITGVGFPGDEGLAYTVGLPDDYAEPYVVTHGFSFPIEITFTPPDESEYVGDLYIESNDPEEPVAAVHLYGNTIDDPTENEPPLVEILDPDNGEYFMDDVAVQMGGYVFDPDEPATNLLCGWFADGTRVDVGDVDPSGIVTGLGLLPVGEVEVTLRCYDSEGLVGEDSAEVTVWPHDEPVVYTLSGGDSVFDWFHIDDDVAITVNGVEVYSDSNHTSDTLPPVEIEAERGDVIGIVATDQNYCDMGIDALVLHWGTGESQALNEAVCDSACADHACYSGSYNGPWPGVYFDEEYTIAIP
ncbi:MAG: choice-of-anchor D domain-containing protein [Pseudomonadota bacterium]|nr:choice-of-anchor D domain-containing protein [Pseudomonadota bacterium]